MKICWKRICQSLTMTVLSSSIFVAQPNLVLDLILHMLTELIYINLVDLVHFSHFSSFFSLFFLSRQLKTGQLFWKTDLGFYAFYFLPFLCFFSLHNPKKANCRNTDVRDLR